MNSGGTLGGSSGDLNVQSNFTGLNTVLNLNVDQTVRSLSGFVGGTGTATINLASGKTLNTANSSATTYSGVLAGVGSFTISGGQLLLSGVNTYSGITTIDNLATLNVIALADINTASSIGKGSVSGSTGDWVFGNGILRFAGGSAVSTNRLFTIGDSNGLTATISADNSVGGHTELHKHRLDRVWWQWRPTVDAEGN